MFVPMLRHPIGDMEFGFSQGNVQEFVKEKPINERKNKTVWDDVCIKIQEVHSKYNPCIIQILLYSLLVTLVLC